jgi:hypothetical protein
MNKTTLASLSLLALLGLTAADTAMAQRDYHSDRRYCASGESGMDFNSCMRQRQRQGYGGDERRGDGDGYGYDRRGDPEGDGYSRGYERRGGYEDREPGWGQPPPQPGYGYQPQWGQRPRNEPPELSDTQKRVLNNCNYLPPEQRTRCRASVMSTVPR